MPADLVRAEHRHNRHEREARTARVQAGGVGRGFEGRGFEGREQRQDTQGLADPVRIHERPAVHGPGVRLPADERRAEIINSSAPTPPPPPSPPASPLNKSTSLSTRFSSCRR